jgi:pyruvate dehydrogenase E2 component (dihydrolipoamide acetyltransferase)
MATDVVMPNLGFDTQAARLIEWLKQPGEPVKKGEVIAIIESDKANVELESIAAGVVLELLANVTDVVAVGEVIARIGEPDADSKVVPVVEPSGPARTVAKKSSPVAKRLASESNLDLSEVEGSGPQGRVMRSDVAASIERKTTAANGAGTILALPKVRQAAREAGIDLGRITPTGARGNVTLADLRAYQASDAAAPPPQADGEDGRQVPLTRVRQLIGQRLGESKREAPHFYVTGQFDLETALARLKSMPAPEPGLNELLQYLTVQTLRRVPALNATYKERQLKQFETINLAIAVARPDGLITPVLHGAERFSLTGLAQASRALIERTRENRLQPIDLRDGTFTISNLGVVRQVDQFTAIINPPQVAILAVGAVKPRAVVIDGGLHIRHTVHLSLSGDHRVIDGLDLGQFMTVFQAELDYFNQG